MLFQTHKTLVHLGNTNEDILMKSDFQLNLSLHWKSTLTLQKEIIKWIQIILKDIKKQKDFKYLH